mgnify:CR=1 FL=1
MVRRIYSHKSLLLSCKFFLMFLILLLTLFCCSDPIEKPKADPFKGMSKKERNLALENAHTRGSKKEQIQIEGYLKRHQIPAVKTGTGIHYCIYKQGEGNQIENGQNVVVDYVVTKINGDTLYTTQTKLDEFTVSNSEKESGLHEAIKLLKSGSKALESLSTLDLRITRVSKDTK